MVLSMERWFGKVAVVTGASSGMGAAIASRLVTEGLQVVGLARRVELVVEKSKSLSKEKGKLHAFKVDITVESEILEAFKWTETTLGHISILVNAAGIYVDTSIISGNVSDWKTTLETNLLGQCICTKAAVKSMQSANIDGHVVHINSYLGHVVPNSPHVSLYAASKFGVTALTEALRQELIAGNSKIKVSGISPGLVETEMTTLSKTASVERIKFLKTLVSLKDEDIVDSIIYVLSTPPHVQVHELTIKPVGEIY